MHHHPHTASPNWAKHLRSLEPASLHALAAVQQSDLAIRQQTAWRIRAVVIARAQGCTWPQIAGALGVTRQSAEKVYGRHCIVDDVDPVVVDIPSQLVPDAAASSS